MDIDKDGNQDEGNAEKPPAPEGANAVLPDVSDSDDSGPEDDNRRRNNMDFVSDFDLMLQKVSFILMEAVNVYSL